VTANWVEKFRTHRITLTFPVLNAAAEVLFLVVGEDKGVGAEGGPEGDRAGAGDPRSGRPAHLGPAHLPGGSGGGIRARSIALSVKILPSILAADYWRLGEQVADAERGGADRFHIDVMDGMFVPNLSLGIPIVEAMRRGTKLPLEIHLMIERPERYTDAFIKAGGDLLILHQEATPNLHRAIQQVRQAGKQVGVGINPATPARQPSRSRGEPGPPCSS
jgi:hypothetical protein